ncbi:MAG: hypothetical protein Q7S37_02830 [bacterium]|nr:hypothetical protein [bacterium]
MLIVWAAITANSSSAMYQRPVAGRIVSVDSDAKKVSYPTSWSLVRLRRDRFGNEILTPSNRVRNFPFGSTEYGKEPIYDNIPPTPSVIATIGKNRDIVYTPCYVVSVQVWQDKHGNILTRTTGPQVKGMNWGMITEKASGERLQIWKEVFSRT